MVGAYLASMIESAGCLAILATVRGGCDRGNLAHCFFQDANKSE